MFQAYLNTHLMVNLYIMEWVKTAMLLMGCIHGIYGVAIMVDCPSFDRTAATLDKHWCKNDSTVTYTVARQNCEDICSVLAVPTLHTEISFHELINGIQRWIGIENNGSAWSGMDSGYNRWPGGVEPASNGQCQAATFTFRHGSPVTFSAHSCEDTFPYQCQQATAPCGASPNIAQATKVYSRCSSSCCFVGGQVNYTCQAGYQLTGFEGSITCNSDGNYSVDASVGTCVALSCSNYTLNSNDHVTGNDTSGSYVYGTVIEFTCEDGYELVGGGGATTKLVRCSASGAGVDWDSTVPTCQAFSCSNYTLNSNNHVTGNDTSGSYVYGTVIEFTCEDGYELVGGGGATTKLVRCSASGARVDWDATVPTCQVPQPASTAVSNYPRNVFTCAIIILSKMLVYIQF